MEEDKTKLYDISANSRGATLPSSLLIQLVDKALTEKGIFAHIKVRLWKEIESKFNEGQCMEEFVKTTMQRCGKLIRS